MGLKGNPVQIGNGPATVISSCFFCEAGKPVLKSLLLVFGWEGEPVLERVRRPALLIIVLQPSRKGFRLGMFGRVAGEDTVFFEGYLKPL